MRTWKWERRGEGFVKLFQKGGEVERLSVTKRHTKADSRRGLLGNIREGLRDGERRASGGSEQSNEEVSEF